MRLPLNFQMAVQLRGYEMDEYKDIEAVFTDFRLGELNRMDAIEVLQKQFNKSNFDAETLVESWEN